MKPEIVFSFLLLALLSCRPKDTTDPGLQIFYPSADTIFQSESRITIQGKASDDGGLSLLSAELVDMIGGILDSDNWPLEEKEISFHFNFTAGNRFTPTGNYIIRITATDLSGNHATYNLPVKLTEVPTILLHVYAAFQNPQNNISDLYEADSLPVLTHKAQLGVFVSDAVMDNRDQNFIFSTGLPQQLKALDPNDLQIVKFNINEPNGALPVSLCTDSYRFVEGLQIDPYLLMYTHDGSKVLSIPADQIPVKAVALAHTKVFVGVRSIDGSINRVEGFRLNSREKIMTINSGWEIRKLLNAGENLVHALGTDSTSGNGKILTINTVLQVQTHITTLNSAYVDAVSAGDNLFILTQSEVYKYNPSTETATLLFSHQGYSCIQYEFLSGLIYLGGMDKIYLYTENGQQISQKTSGNGQAKMIRFHYNK